MALHPLWEELTDTCTPVHSMDVPLSLPVVQCTQGQVTPHWEDLLSPVGPMDDGILGISIVQVGTATWLICFFISFDFVCRLKKNPLCFVYSSKYCFSCIKYYKLSRFNQECMGIYLDCISFIAIWHHIFMHLMYM